MPQEKFNINKLLNAKSQPANETADNFQVKMISVYKLVPSEDNFYSVEDIADLKDSIEMMGIKQNLLIKPIPNTDTYKIIAGHRRRLASLKLVEEGKGQYEFIPCRVESDLDEFTERLQLIYTNSTTRQLSDWEKVEQMAQLKPLLQEYKKTHKLPGRVRELMAEALNVSPTQAGRLEVIDDNLIPELKEKMKNNDLKFSAAAGLATLPQEQQMSEYEEWKGNKKPKETKHNEGERLFKALTKFLKSESGQMTISEDAKKVLSENAGKINELEYGNIDFVVNNGKIIRIDIKQSIKPSENK